MMAPNAEAKHSRPARTTDNRLFPVEPPSIDSDSRFTLGLILDVLAVLTEHGYPDAQRSSSDFIEMRQALFGFLYRRRGEL